jgi:hypothetical protein
VRTWRLPREEVGRAALSLGVGEMVAYSFLMLHSSILGKDPSHQEQEAFSPASAVRHTTLPAIHRQVLMWLLEDLVLWFIETDRIKTFRPRRN